MTDNERYIRDRATVMSILKFTFMTALVFAGCYFATKIMVIMIPFLIGFLLAKTSHAMATPFTKLFAKNPYPKRLQKRLSLVAYVILLIFIGLVTVWGFFALFDQITRGAAALQALATQTDWSSWGSELFDKLSKENGGFIDPELRTFLETKTREFMIKSTSKFPDIIASAVTGILGALSQIPYWIFVVICVILSGYYFISDGPRVLKFYMRNIPNKSFRNKSVILINDLSTTLFRVIGGYTVLLIITAVEAYVAFYLAGVDYAVVLSIVTGVIDFMPVLGISATMIPVMVFCAFKGNFTAIIILIIAMTIMTVVRRWIEPPILGKSMKLHPLLMLIAMAAGVYIWGPIGFLLGPTVMIIIVQTIKAFSIDKKLMAYFSVILNKFMKPADDKVEAQ